MGIHWDLVRDRKSSKYKSIAHGVGDLLNHLKSVVYVFNSVCVADQKINKLCVCFGLILRAEQMVSER